LARKKSAPKDSGHRNLFANWLTVVSVTPAASDAHLKA